MITTVIADGKKEYEFIDFLKKRAQSSDKNVIPTVAEILDNVRENGDSGRAGITPLNSTARRLSAPKFRGRDRRHYREL